METIASMINEETPLARSRLKLCWVPLVESDVLFVALQIWNTAATEPFVRRFLGHSDHVTRCAFADTKGQAVLSCGSDGTVRERQGDREEQTTPNEMCCLLEVFAQAILFDILDRCGGACGSAAHSQEHNTRHGTLRDRGNML